MQRWLLKIIDLASTAQDAAMLKRELGRIVERAGFDRFIYLDIRPSGTKLVSNAPREWQARYLMENWALHDPVITLARKSVRAFRWDLKQWSTLARSHASDLLLACQAAGMSGGLSIPIKTGFGHLAILTMTTFRPERFTDLPVDEVVAATAVAQLHCRLQTCTGTAPATIVTALTPKQALCLRWAAEGKSMKDIAAMEEIKSSTVVFHLNNARKTLEAMSLPQATAIATKLQLI
ncbi:autoinducer binding domain-containing protein [Rhizobium sp. TRM96647]|uniref:autoinducer binding domain-containing protein n=1 Tax=unclassified Rhizobium TaxID=2613769 RepID=UPI0021E93933|nr:MULTISPECIES: autoinducer binding domain-containing protein [unclassified Rhizobium]MCV3739534.1 autoinducer binding domain-containing protein [Rhizobium sp. TRM96647]MCV3761220.1 autoinducer binding domain-containing protein [Rhizobium sp. TRM96650]